MGCDRRLQYPKGLLRPKPELPDSSYFSVCDPYVGSWHLHTQGLSNRVNAIDFNAAIMQSRARRTANR
jgi:hypothetical protein